MTPEEEHKILQVNEELPGETRLTLVVTGDERTQELRSFCYELSALASNISVFEKESEEENLPAIELGTNLRFIGVPGGRELDPFLHALRSYVSDFLLLPAPVRDKIETVENPALVRMYVAQQCPTCPATVRQIVPLGLMNDLIQVEIIDAVLFEELAKADNVQGVPTTLLDEEFRWTGATTLEEIVEVLANRDPSSLSASAFERMLQEGNAAKVAEMILDREQMFPAFVDLLATETFSTRLGAMAAMEDIVRKNPDLASEIVTPLWEQFHRVIEPVQIDLLYLFGEVGTPETIPILESVLDGNYRDHVKEIAREAIDSIRERYSLGNL